MELEGNTYKYVCYWKKRNQLFKKSCLSF